MLGGGGGFGWGRGGRGGGGQGRRGGVGGRNCAIGAVEESYGLALPRFDRLRSIDRLRAHTWSRKLSPARHRLHTRRQLPARITESSPSINFSEHPPPTQPPMQLLLALLLVLLPPAAQPFCPAPNPARPACTPAPLRSWLKTGRVPPSSPSPPSASPPPAPSFYNITLPRSPGLSWRTDLSFRYVSVSSVDPGGPAAGTRVRAGDQLAAVAGESVVGLDFDGAMQAFGRLPRDAGRMELTLFAGSREEMLAELGGGGGGGEERVHRRGAKEGEGASQPQGCARRQPAVAAH